MESYKHIVVATDFTEFSENAVNRAVNLAKLCNAELTLLHVVEQFQYNLYTEYFPIENVDPWKYATEHSQERLEQLGKRIEYPKTKLLMQVTQKSAKHEIVRVAKEIKADLVVTGAHGHSGLRTLLGSTAEGVVQLAPCEVLVVRSQPTNRS
jgi:universal stress protein A